MSVNVTTSLKLFTESDWASGRDQNECFFMRDVLWWLHALFSKSIVRGQRQQRSSPAQVGHQMQSCLEGFRWLTSRKTFISTVRGKPGAYSTGLAVVTHCFGAVVAAAVCVASVLRCSEKK